MQDWQLLRARLDLLVIFRSLREDSVISALLRFINAKDSGEKRLAYADLTAQLYASGCGMGEYIRRTVLDDENLYVRKCGKGDSIAEPVKDALTQELKTLQDVADLQAEDFQRELDAKIGLEYPSWESEPVNLTAAFRARMARIGQEGYGIWSRYTMFAVDDAGEILPVRHPDPIQFSDLTGYQRERRQVYDNTVVLLHGGTAANVLLSGDAGTGKSATVKAIANTLAKDGLRLIELKKSQLAILPQVMERVADNPLKFILFVDDLTLDENDPNLGTLKGILEGSAASRISNAVIYATSNRRHLMKETFDDGSDKHERETVQERISLSERFGMTITFMRPQKQGYLETVHAMAEQAGLELNEEEEKKLDAGAEQFALQKSGRSARVARQYMDRVLAKKKEEEEKEDADADAR